MLTYQLSNKNFAVRLINLFTDCLPQSLCMFFWTFLFVIVFLPITLFGLLFYHVIGEDTFREKTLTLITVLGFITITFSLAVGFLLAALIWHTLPTLLILAGTCLFYYIIWLFIDNDHKVIKDGFRSVKNKTCPKIEYID